METVRKIVNDPELFKESRYALVKSLPGDLGSLSLGYSNGEPKIYLTKLVGSEGCIDWNLASFLSTWKQAITERKFTPELASLFQGVTNELMPGFAFDIATFHWFLRPHAQNTKVGFALFGSRSFNVLTQNDPNSLQNLQFLSENIHDLLPSSSFVFRRWATDAAVGEVSADIFVMVSSTSNIFLQVCFKFLFNPATLSANAINQMSQSVQSNHVSKTNVVSHRNNGADSSQSADAAPNGTNANNARSHQNAANSKNVRNDGQKDQEQGNQCGADGPQKKWSIGKEMMLYPGSTIEWFTKHKFALLSASLAGFAITATTKGISRDLRIKL